MNRIFRIIWSQALKTWVVVSELATRRGKRSGGVDERVKPTALVLDRNMVEGSPPATVWPLRMGILLALLSLYAPARAADRYWDVNGTAVNTGGTGTWNLTSPFWSPNGDGVSGPFSAWNNAALDNAFFSGVPGTVTLGVPITVHNLTFQSNGYTLDGSTLTLGGVTPTININSGAAVINSTVAGTAGLTKTGGGHLHLLGSNTFTGGINLSGGRLIVGSDAGLGAASNGVVMANGTQLMANGPLSASRVVTVNGMVQLHGSGVGSARFTGTGSINAQSGVTLSNDASDYTGQTIFATAGFGGSYAFTSIADLGVASSLGAPTTVANGTISAGSSGGVGTGVSYLGDGDSSNRNWVLSAAGAPAPVYLSNSGTGTLTLTGNIATPAGGGVYFQADTADLALLGVISGVTGNYTGSSPARTITLGGANTYSTASNINNVTVRAGVLADTGIASSFGAGTAGAFSITNNGVLSYTGTGSSSNRTVTLNNGTLSNDGSGALTLSGAMTIVNTATLGGSFNGAANTYSGVISGPGGNLAKTGASTWLLTGANTYTGTTTVNAGTLLAGNAQAFGASNPVVVNGGTLDLNNLSMAFPSLSGTGGSVALGSGTLALNVAAGPGTSYAGSITGTGGLTKLGAGIQTLTGSNTYTGATTVNGGTLGLNFAPAGGPTSDIISSASTLNLGGGTLAVTGAAGESNTQTFDGLNVTGGNNTISATSGSGGNLTVNLGDINRTSGLINFQLPASGNITTTDTTLGGWATVNGTDYAKVVGGNITAFTAADYSNKDNAANWLNNEFITDTTGFFGTVGSSVQLGGLRYTRPVSTTVTVAGGQTLGVDGTIIVAPTVGPFNQLINGGAITGTSGGGVLGIQQNGTGNFTINSQIVDNTGSIGFTKAGTGLVTLSNNANNYTGATTVAQGTLAVTSIGNGGTASAIGASSAASSNLVLEGGTLRYLGGATSSNRGFTLAKSGAILAGTVEVANGAANLSFSGQVTSSDGAGLTKTGPGTLTLANAGNNYTGVTTVSGGTLAVSSLTNGGLPSSIGAASSASSNLVLNGGELEYTGATASTNRGFTLGTSNGAIDVSNAATTLTISGTAASDTLPGPDGLIKNGAGTLVLSGTNTYNGTTTVNAGTLRAGSTQAFGVLVGGGTNGVALANNPGATLDLNGFNNTVGFLSGGGAAGGNVALGSATLTLNGGSATYAGNISGTGGLTRLWGGEQTMVGCNNSYTGVTTIDGGVVSVDCLANGGVNSGIGASSSASGNLVLKNSGWLRYTGGTVSTDRGITLGGGWGAFDVTNAATALTFSGQVVGAGGVYKDGAGTLVLSGNNTYTAISHVQGGTLRAGSSTAFGNASNGMSMANVAGALLDLNGFNTTVGYLTGGGSAGGNIALGTGTLTLGGVGNANYGGAISGSGGLIKNGGGDQLLSGCNSSYTGSTTINAGTVLVACLNNGGVNSSIGASSAAPSNLTLNGQLMYVGTGSSSDRLFTLGTAGGYLNSTGTGALQLTNTGFIALTGTNTARTLTLTGDNTGNNVLAAQLNNNGTGVTSLSKTGTGNWELTNNNSSYTGVTSILGGVLEVTQLANGGMTSGIGASSSAASNLVIGNNSTLRYTGVGDSTNRLFTLAPGVTYIESDGSGPINFTNTGVIALSGVNAPRTIALGGTSTGMNTLAATIADSGTGQTTLAKNDSGTWVLIGNNTYTGNTVINDGNLMIGNGGTSGNLGTGNVIIDSPTSTLSINQSDNVVFNATMSGPGTFAQVGTGITTLTANSSVGATQVNAGTLDVNGTLDTATIAMNGNSTLNVDGTVQAAGGTASVLTGGAGASTINVNNGAILRANGNLGDGSDTLNVSGTLDTGTAALNLGAGNDTLRLNDGAVINGPGVDGGAGTADNLVVNNAVALTFGGTGVSGFEQLTKQNTGVLTLTGNQSYSAGTAITGGTLGVNGTLETSTVSMTDGTTLNVDGTVQGMGGTTATFSGSAGANTILVNSGAILRANGDLGAGTDGLTLSGTLATEAAALSLGAGDETFTLRDGASISGVGVNGGAGNDQLVLDNAAALTFSGSQAAGFESLLKQNTGTATMTGSQSFIAGAAITGGALDVDGALTTPTVTLADGTTLNVDGSVQAGVGVAAVITGSTGANTVSVGAGGSLLANGDLGAGNDVLDVAGTLDTDGGTLALGDGDDTLTIHDGTTITGTVIAGAGNDTFNTNIATSADLGAVQGFETLSKSGAGVLNVNGPMSSDFTTVDVFAGTLNVTAGGSVVPAPGDVLTTTVATGATLNVDGSYGCGAGNDTMSVSGTVSGSGTIDLCGGEDTLTLNDGAVLNNVISGGAHGTGDTVALNNAGTLSFDASNTIDFEYLRKDNTGVATLTGSQTFSGGITITGGTLEVDGTLLNTPTVAMGDDTALTIDGGLLGFTPTTITGSAGTNTVTINGTALATGDLGAGNDVLDVAGTLGIAGGTFALGDGDDTFTVHDGTNVYGTIDGGAGNDTRVYDIDTTATLGALVNFEGVTKTGTGVLNLNGPGATDLQEVEVLGGTLNVGPAGSVVATAGSALNTVVASGATLNVDGSYGCGASNDTMTVSGTVSGSGTIDLCDGEDTLTLNDGAVLNNVISGGAHGTGDTVVLNNAAALSFDAANTINFEYLRKDNTGVATLTGSQTFVGGTTITGGTLDVDGTLNTPTVAMGDDTTLNVDGLVQAGPGTAATLTGSAGVNTVTVGTGGTLLASGDLGAGNDVLDVAGTLDTIGGSFALGDGDDTFTIHDGTNVLGTVVGGAGNDTFNADIATTADLGAVQGFETLSKTNVGALNINGPMSSDFTTVNVLGGTLNVTAGGGVSAQSTTVAAGATLDVQGNYTGTAGNDVLDVAGTLIAGTPILLGDGDDTFTIHDGTQVIGTVDGGAGLDTRVYDINTTADLGALVNFEGVTKTGTGLLNLNGPGATDLQEAEVLGGTLNVGPGGSIVATAGSALNTVVASGATLNVDGSYGCGASNDTMTVSGTVSGSGTIDLCGGEDTLTLNDGAVLNNVISGGGHGTGDTVVLNNAAALSFDAANTINFEYLRKDNTGVATLTGSQTFVGGTTINGGTLDVDGTLNTPTVAMGDDATLNVDGLVQAGPGTAATLTGSAGVNTVTVGTGGTLLASGDLGAGNDVLDVAGTLDTIGGSFALGDGDDTFTIHDGTNVLGTVVGGAGNDTFNADIATTADLGAVQGFETLSKTNVGALNINGPMSSDFTTVNVLGGTLNVTAGGSVSAQSTTVAAGATLDVQGSYTGTAGNDTFSSRGTVIGALAFGTGNDAVDFIGGDVSGLTDLDGGAGNDRLGFSGLIMDDATLPTLTDWERVELLGGSELTLGSMLDLNNGVLAIDGTSALFANAGAGIGGSVENAGLISVGSHRLAIHGYYTGDDGQLDVLVSPANGTSGGLDIGGDVVGTTGIVFHSDGTAATDAEPTHIKVIDSPNDTLGNGGFVADGGSNDNIRLAGDLFTWKLGQEADNNWYLTSDTSTLLPEVPGYTVLPSIGLAGLEESNRLLFQRLSGVRGEQPHCTRRDEKNPRAYASLFGDCHGVWMAATGSELEMGANPGFEFSGDSVGLFVGVDRLLQDRGKRTFRGGAYAGYQRGNYWTSGVNSTALESGAANVGTDTLTVGMYGSFNWKGGTYLDASWVGQLASADVVTEDGFHNDGLSGNNLAASVRMGQRFDAGIGWSVEPQLELKVMAVQWGDMVDAGGKQVTFDDDVLGQLRLANRVEKLQTTANGGRVRYWATLGLQDRIGEKEQLVGIGSASAQGTTQWMPNHQLGLAATLDVGVEAELRKNVSLFGVLSLDQELDGTDYEQRAANLGVRIRW